MKMKRCQFKRRRVRMRKDLEILVMTLKKLDQSLPKKRLLKKQLMEMNWAILVMMLTKENKSINNQTNKMKQEKRMILPNSTL